MPPRGVVGLIAIFWLGSTLWLGYREWWVKYVTDAPPELTIDIADEATTVQPPTRWVLIRNDQLIGQAVSRMGYHPADDTFELHNELKKVELSYPLFQPFELRIVVPKFETMQRVTRSGELRELTAFGTMSCAARSGPIVLFKFELSADIHGLVQGKDIQWTCELNEPSMGKITPKIEPTPVPSGSVLNPLQPLGRIRGLRLGQRWELTLVDPLSDAIANSLPKLVEQWTQKEGGAEPIAFPIRSGPRVLLAKVGTNLSELDSDRGKVSCQVIEYHEGETLLARTWVEAATGKVVRQEAFQMGERLTLQREDLDSKVGIP